MRYDPERHHRRSIRLVGYDYTAQNAYFVTLCAEGRACVFGEVVAGVMRLHDAGRMVATVWNELATHYPGVATDAFVVMPDHVHGIIVLTRGVGSGQVQGPAPTGRERRDVGDVGAAPRGRPEFLGLGDVVHRFKTLTTFRYGEGVKNSRWPRYRGRLWQRNYYEHVVRDEDSLNRIRQYIADNPTRWHLDYEKPDVPIHSEEGLDEVRDLLQ